jgi:hypothetical protein
MSRTNIYGLSVALHDRCWNCDSDIAIVGTAPPPYFTQLRCDSCDCARGYVGTDLSSFLEELVDRFGRQPTRPIVLRTGQLREPVVQPGSAAALNLKEPEMKLNAVVQPAGAAAQELQLQLPFNLIKEPEMKLHDLFPSKYLRAADLNGKPLTAVIKKVSHETFKDDGADVTKAVLHFEGSTAPLVVNKTNWQMLAAITGADDDDGWTGQKIELRSQKVMGPGGKVVDSIRIHDAG